MITQKRVTIRDLVEEAKKRVVVLVVCAVGLSYIMSLTSASVLINLPAAACLIILLRYFSLDFEMRSRAAKYNSKPSSVNILTQKKLLECPKVVEQSNWRMKVNSPVVEKTLDHFTRRLISEWVTDLWYSRLTPDKEGPEELIQIINGVLGEFSSRMRNINLIDLLTRDLVNLICHHLELFRWSQVKIEKQKSGPLTFEQRDVEIRHVLASENKLHPALFSAESEHKVLQHVMDGLITFTFRPRDLQCSFFRYTVRELLACAVIRPILNIACPKFINERIESVVVSMTKAKEAVTEPQEPSKSKLIDSPRISSDHFSKLLDPNVTGVELVQLKNDQSITARDRSEAEKLNGTDLSKDPLLSIDTQSSRSWSSVPLNSSLSDEGDNERQHSVEEWSDMLDKISRRKTEALAPEHFESMWAKGRNYRKTEGKKGVIEQVPQHSSAEYSGLKGNDQTNLNFSRNHTVHHEYTRPHKTENFSHGVGNKSSHSSVKSYLKSNEDTNLEETDSESRKICTSEDEEPDNVTGLDSPGTKVWDGRTNRNLAISHIRHPLENLGNSFSKRSNRGHAQYQQLRRNQSGRKRSRMSSQTLPIWQEVERTSLTSGDGQDILGSLKEDVRTDDSSDDSDTEFMDKHDGGETISSSRSYVSLPESCNDTVKPLKSSLMGDSFFKLKCEVVGANIVKNDSKTFAVYSLSVEDVNSKNWSIKRRFRHFEELHRRLKEFPVYNLHLPPKHFLSTGLDIYVIQERCILLDRYLKNLLRLPTVSESIELWDFLSVDSQTYVFSSSFSIVETLSVHPEGESNTISSFPGPLHGPVSSKRESFGDENRESTLQTKNKYVADGLKSRANDSFNPSAEIPGKKDRKVFDSPKSSETSVQKNPSIIRNSRKIVEEREVEDLEEKSGLLDGFTDPTFPSEWVPPNLTIPVLDLVDVIFQLQDGGWIRRKAFWLAKQILQLGMGDALDDWLIEKIQVLRRGSVVASGVKRVEQILWPDGIFITKHPKRQQPPPPPPSSPTSENSPRKQQPTETSSPILSDEQQQQETNRRAKFVYELMIDKAPAAIVSLVGRKEYEQSVGDLYYFLQSSVCLKQLAFDLLELLLLSAFPELDSVFAQLHQEKHKFGELNVK